MARKGLFTNHFVDPGAFTQFCSKIGVENIQVNKVNLLDQTSFLHHLRPVYGFMLLVKQSDILSETSQTVQDYNIYFSNKIFDEALFLDGLFHILFNCDQIDRKSDLNPLNLGPTNQLFKEAYRDLIGSIPQERYHSIAYVFCQGKLWELDALKNGPRIVEVCSESNWLDFMQAELMKKTEVYQRLDLPISVWAITEDRKLVYQRKLVGKLFMKQEIERLLDKNQSDWRIAAKKWEEEYRYALDSNGQHKRGLLLSRKLLSYCKSVEQLSGEEQQKIHSLLSNQQDNLMDTWLQIHDDVLRLYKDLGLEDEKEEMRHKNQMRRKHDYIPFIKLFIQSLHEEGHLGQLSL